ncbi:hypothetical protein FQA39_LY12254 [Lamprigera yunnana]|nr:hypothetical protein FQA39_LY12254 [Lamprigera yunnana]
MLNKLEENNKKLEVTNQKLDETRAEIRTEMDQSMEKMQRQFLTIQERINEKWEKKHVEVDCKMVEIQEQIDNNNGQINSICQRLREQGIKLINVEAKINQVKEERIQVCEDLKVQKREIENYIEEKIKIGNEAIGYQYDQDAIIKEATRGETETWYKTKVGEYRNFKQFWKGFIKNYWGTKEESVMKSELYGTKFNHSLRISREEYVLNKTGRTITE